MFKHRRLIEGCFMRENPIFQVSIALTDTIPLNVYLVKGSDYAVWIDSGIKSMFPQLQATMQRAGVAANDLRFILHTHSHHDHIGSNAQLKMLTGCLIAAHPHYARWHSDFEFHYQDFARAFPHLMPDTPALRAEVLDILDEPRPLDIMLQEDNEFHLGGGVSLRAVSLPGHMLAEFGWFEASTRTLILGDAVTGLEWGLFHSHLTVQGYRSSLDKIRWLISEWGIQEVLFAHFMPMQPAEALLLLDKAHAYIDSIEANLIRMLAEKEQVTLQELWSGLCSRMNRLQEFRSLNMVYAHIKDLLEREFIREVGTETYQLR
jgi:glyoxylase-like metal-dependent hydrolase (beta-lactamase superfamily II)